MERPALRELLSDVEAGQIDVVVIYKIDRLTRSLADFARIVEVLEKADASFVSVTQSFNTKTSMGRLMLHVLLSFAQFEREVGAERVRDKIAASKAKGMWMGGTVPLGYDAIDRKLVINEPGAETVRAIFARLVLGDANDLSALQADPQLLALLRDAHRAQALALAKPKFSLEQLATKFGRSPERYKRLLRLSYLSPKIIQAIVEGQQPARLTNRFLQNLDGIPLSWCEQGQLLLS